MRNLAAVLFLALAACGGGSDNPTPDSAPPADTLPPDTQPPPPDSQVLDTTCAANTTTPTTAAATVTASGFANSLDISFAGGTPTPVFEGLPEADVDTCVDNCAGNDLLDSTTSSQLPCAQEGCVFTTGTLDTNDVPLNAYLKVSAKGHRTTNIFPSEPIRADLANVPALAMTIGAFNALAQFLGGGQTAGNGAILVVVTDCALTPVQTSTLTVQQKGADIPGAEIVDAGLLAAELAGTFIVFDVPPGTTTIGATVDGTAFRAHDIEVFADETSATQVTPGFAAP
jgi:hypothetical protein